jgi:hypothetical protein
MIGYKLVKKGDKALWNLIIEFPREFMIIPIRDKETELRLEKLATEIKSEKNEFDFEGYVIVPYVNMNKIIRDYYRELIFKSFCIYDPKRPKPNADTC